MLEVGRMACIFWVSAGHWLAGCWALFQRWLGAVDKTVSEHSVRAKCCQADLLEGLLCFSFTLLQQRALSTMANCPFSCFVSRWGWSETQRSHPKEHRNRAGCGNAQPDGAPGQPWVHWGQHEQLWIGGKVSHWKWAGWLLARCSALLYLLVLLQGDRCVCLTCLCCRCAAHPIRAEQIAPSSCVAGTYFSCLYTFLKCPHYSELKLIPITFNGSAFRRIIQSE